MDSELLVRDRLAEGTRFLKAFEPSFPFALAYWLKKDAESDFELYVLPTGRAEVSSKLFYTKAQDVLRSLREPKLELSEVSLARPSDPIVCAALKYYRSNPAKIPRNYRDATFGGVSVHELYLIRGPLEEFDMLTGREVLNQIIDREAEFFQQNGCVPRKIKLPVMMAYDLAKCSRNEIGDLSGEVFMDGIKVFEEKGFHGMKVEIIRDVNSALELE